MTTLEDYQPVHAHWIPKGDFGGYAKVFVCSNCGKEIETENWTNAPEDEFCWHCGAIMDEKGYELHDKG